MTPIVLALVVWLTHAAAEDRQSLVARLNHDLAEAEAAQAAGSAEEAGRRYEDAMRLAEQLGTENLLLARAIDGLADARRLAGRLHEAEDLYLRSVPLWVRLLGEAQPRLAVTLHNLGAVCVAQGRPADAVPHLRRALAIWEITRGLQSVEAAQTRTLLDRASGPQAH